jgi:hypothetical protein
MSSCFLANAIFNQQAFKKITKLNLEVIELLFNYILTRSSLLKYTSYYD